MPRRLSIAAALLVISSSASHAQDALQGKRIYLDAARIVGSTVSCVDCHGGLPPGLFGIGRAANNPAIVANALNAIPQMMPLRGRLSAQQIADVAAYIGNPAVPSPALTFTTRSATGAQSIDRLDFGAVVPGQTPARGTVRVANTGALPLQLTSNFRVVGPHAAEFALLDNGCAAVSALAAGQSCETVIAFAPAVGSSGLRSAAAQVDHEWVGGTAAVALLGTVESSAANAPVAASGGGGASLIGWLAVIASAAAIRDRSRARRRWSRLYRHS